ncbi:MAG TPA: hypothetical protein VF637_11075 [Sphingomicrobium sp.]
MTATRFNLLVLAGGFALPHQHKPSRDRATTTINHASVARSSDYAGTQK